MIGEDSARQKAEGQGTANMSRPAADWRRALVVTVTAVVATRLLLVAIGLAAIARAGPRPAADQFVSALSPSAPLLQMWARWDGQWYLDIAARGYRAPLPGDDYDMRPNFFPALPLAIRVLSPLIGHPALAGVVISNLALIGALTLLHAWTRARSGPGVADRLVWIYGAFPTSFFLSAIYAESLLLACLAGGWWAASRGRWITSGALAAIGTWCRPTGALAVPALAVMAWRDGTPAVRPRLRRMTSLLVPAALGVAGYLVFAHLTFGDALATVQTQSATRSPIDWPWAAFAPAWQDMALWGGYANSAIDAVLAVAALAALPFVFTTVGAAEGLFAALVTIVPLTSGLVSYSRMILPAFPLFALVAVRLGGWSLWVVVALMLVLQGALFASFAAGGWVG